MEFFFLFIKNVSVEAANDVLGNVPDVLSTIASQPANINDVLGYVSDVLIDAAHVQYRFYHAGVVVSEHTPNMTTTLTLN